MVSCRCRRKFGLVVAVVWVVWLNRLLADVGDCRRWCNLVVVIGWQWSLMVWWYKQVVVLYGECFPLVAATKKPLVAATPLLWRLQMAARFQLFPACSINIPVLVVALFCSLRNRNVLLVAFWSIYLKFHSLLGATEVQTLVSGGYLGGLAIYACVGHEYRSHRLLFVVECLRRCCFFISFVAFAASWALWLRSWSCQMVWVVVSLVESCHSSFLVCVFISCNWSRIIRNILC